MASKRIFGKFAGMLLNRQVILGNTQQQVKYVLRHRHLEAARRTFSAVSAAESQKSLEVDETASGNVPPLLSADELLDPVEDDVRPASAAVQKLCAEILALNVLELHQLLQLIQVMITSHVFMYLQ